MIEVYRYGNCSTSTTYNPWVISLSSKLLNNIPKKSNHTRKLLNSIGSRAAPPSWFNNLWQKGPTRALHQSKNYRRAQKTFDTQETRRSSRPLCREEGGRKSNVANAQGRNIMTCVYARRSGGGSWWRSAAPICDN